MLIPQLEMIFGVTGSFCGVLIVFVWPALYYLAMVKKEKAKPMDQRSKWFIFNSCNVTTAWIILVIGIILCVLCTGLEISKLVK